MSVDRLAATRREPRRIAFYVVVLSAALLLVIFGSIFALASPWIPDPPEGPGYDAPKDHRWHDAQWGAFTGIMYGAMLLTLLRRPEGKPLVVQFLVVATLVFTVLALIAGYTGVVAFLVPVALVAALYPDPSALRSFSPGRPASWNLVQLAVAVISLLVALPYAIDHFRLQLDDLAGDEHAEFHHWALALPPATNLAIAGALAATGRPGARIVGALAGVAFDYLGVAAITSLDAGDDTNPAGIWGATAAVLSIAAGIVYRVTTLWRERLLAWAPWLDRRPRTAS
jgi:hypothetical protein